MPKITGTRSYNVRITQHVTLEVSDTELAANRDAWFDANGYATPDLDQYMCQNGSFKEDSEQQLDAELEYDYEPDGGVIDYAPLEEQVPNTGSLEGIACPRCGSTVSFEILATTTVTMEDGGAEDNTGYEWTDDALITCNDCHRTGTVGEFRVSRNYLCLKCLSQAFIARDGSAHHWHRSTAADGLTYSLVDHDADTDHVPDFDLDD